MNDLMKHYTDLIGFCGRSLPEAFEFILFDTASKELPIIACANRLNGTHDITRELIKNILKNDELVAKGSVENFPQTTPACKIIKTSVNLIKDENDAVIGAFCINTKCDVFLQLQSLTSSVLNFSVTAITDPVYDKNPEDEYAEPSLDMIAKAVEKYGVEPGRVTQNERMEIICDLYDVGVFELKGAVAKTAEVLEMSQQSIYRYLSQIKKARS